MSKRLDPEPEKLTDPSPDFDQDHNAERRVILLELHLCVPGARVNNKALNISRDRYHPTCTVLIRFQ